MTKKFIRKYFLMLKLLKNNQACLLVVVGRVTRVAVAGGPVVEVSHGVTAVVVVAAAAVVVVVGEAQVVEVMVGGLVAGAGALHGRGTARGGQKY